MKSILTIAVLSTLGLSTGAVSAAPRSDVATVISATPVYERVSAPRRECVTEQVASYDERRIARPATGAYVADPRPVSGAGALFGAIVGGVIGHQFGNSPHGTSNATAAGAVIGGLIGNDIEAKNGGGAVYSSGYRRAAYYDVERVPVSRDVQRCYVVQDYRNEVRGYDVHYRYHGRDYQTRLDYDPGPSLPINVEVRPSYRAPAPSYNRY